MKKTSSWVIATGFGALVIAALAWFFGIQPRLDAAQVAREQTESERARVDTLEIQLAQLRKDFDNIDEFKAELAALRVQVPTDELTTDLIRQLQEHAVTAGVVITNAISETPVPITVTREETVQPEEGAEETEPSVQQVSTVSDFVVMPVRIRTVGDFATTLEFLRLVQTENPRLILVSDLRVVSLDEKVAEGGLPEILDGWIDTEHTFFVIVLPDPDAVLPDPGPLPIPGEDATSPFTRLVISGDPITGTPSGVVVPSDDVDDTEADGGGEEGEDEG